MLHSIGEALGLLPQFRSWLRSSLAAMAVEITFETSRPGTLWTLDDRGPHAGHRPARRLPTRRTNHAEDPEIIQP